MSHDAFNETASGETQAALSVTGETQAPVSEEVGELVEPVATQYRYRHKNPSAIWSAWGEHNAALALCLDYECERRELVPASALTAANADRDRLEKERDEALTIIKGREALAGIGIDGAKTSVHALRDTMKKLLAVEADRDRLARELEEAREALKGSNTGTSPDLRTRARAALASGEAP